MNTTIGKRIRNYREKKGYSQEELAEQLHISRSTYQRIENGETNSWINHIEKICDSLDVTLEDILRPEEGFLQVNNTNDSSNENASNNLIQNQTNHYHNSEKLIEQYEQRLKDKDQMIEQLKKLLNNK